MLSKYCFFTLSLRFNYMLFKSINEVFYIKSVKYQNRAYFDQLCSLLYISSSCQNYDCLFSELMAAQCSCDWFNPQYFIPMTKLSFQQPSKTSLLITWQSISFFCKILTKKGKLIGKTMKSQRIMKMKFYSFIL